MVQCYICNQNNANQRLFGINDDNDNRRRNIAALHRERFGFNPTEIEQHTRICLNCAARINTVIEMAEDPDALSMEVVVGSRRGHCFICNRNCMLRLSIEARVDFYMKTEKYLNDDKRCCNQHLSESGLIQLQFMDNHISVPIGVRMTGVQATQWITNMRNYAMNVCNSRFSEETNFEDEDFRSLTSLTKEQFRELYTYCDPVNIGDQLRRVTKKHLITFLMKIRQGLSDNFIKSLMGWSSRQNVSLAIQIVRASLMATFVPQNLGFHSVEVENRHHFINQHVTNFANLLYNANPEQARAILYPDCTYIKAPKSTHFRVQRQSYSPHKKYTLLKAGLIVAPDGYILDIHGPYFSDARNNDANILIHELNDDAQSLRNWVQDGDIFVVDRGYRDAVQFLEGLNLNCEIPPFLPRGQRQYTTEEANRSRMITKTRWIVESRNGHLKSIFKFFRDMVPMQHCLQLKSFLRIACALINKYHQTIYMQDATEELAQRMLEIQQENINRLQVRIQHDQQLLFGRGQGAWHQMHDHDLPEFPRLNMDYLRLKTLGTYQVRLSPGYAQDTMHRNLNNEFVFQVQRYEAGLVRAKICSRFTQAIKHTILIQYDDGNNEEEPINGTYCTCKSGARTVGVCAHIACVLWYLGYARHEDNIRYPSNALLRTTYDAAARDEAIIIE